MPTTVYLDLDRTLYDTQRSGRVLWTQLSRWYGLEFELEQARQKDFFVWSDETTYYYDIAAHMRDAGIDPDHARSQLVATLADNELLLPGAEEFVQNVRELGVSVAILTYGDVYFQSLKLALCPVLHDLPFHITLEPKQVFLATKGSCILVDDKPIAQKLPPNVHFLHVQLETSKILDTTTHTYTDLDQVFNEIRMILTK